MGLAHKWQPKTQSAADAAAAKWLPRSKPV